MSQTIDNRVVQMGFESSEFEKGAKKAIKTLDKLDDALKLKNGVKSFQDVEEAAAKVDFQPLLQAVDEVKDRFNILDKAVNWAVKNVVDSMMNMSKKMLKSLTIDPIATGYSKYEEKVASVQTLLNSTGLTIDEVNGYLNKLMTFSDETSYSFTQMTSALATMTSAGGNIETLVPMLEGVANATAFAGKSAREFSGAIFNLNQSYAGGYLTYTDYNSLDRTYNMFSKQLKQAFIDCAKAAGTLDEEGRTASGTLVEVTNFAQTLSEKWADRTVMENAFGYFAEMTEEAQKLVDSGVYDTFSEAYDAIAENYDEVQAAAAKSAQEAKTFTEAIDATKDAVASGFMQSIELLIGGYDEAKVLWTDLSNTLYDLFAQPGNNRNEILSEVLNSKWSQFNDQLTEIGINSDTLQSKLLETGKTLGLVTDDEIESLESLRDVMQSDWMNGDIFAEAIQNYAGTKSSAIKSTEEQLTEVTAVAREILQGSWGNAQTRINALTDAGYDAAQMQEYANILAARGVITAEDLGEAVSENVDISDEQREALEALANEATDTESVFGSLLASINEVSGRDKLLQSVKNILGNFATVLANTQEAFADVFGKDMAASLSNFIDGFFNLSENLKLDDVAASSFHDALTGVMSGAKFILQTISPIVSILSPISGIARSIISAVIDLTGIVGRVFSLIIGSNIAQSITSWIRSVFSDVNGFLYGVMVSIDKFRESIAKLTGKDEIQKFFGKIGTIIGNFGKRISSISDIIRNFMQPAFSGIQEFVRSFISIISGSLPSWQMLKEKIQNVLNLLPTLLDSSTAFTRIRTKFRNLFNTVSEGLLGIRTYLGSLTKEKINGWFEKFVEWLSNTRDGILSFWQIAQTAFAPAIDRIKNAFRTAFNYIQTTVWPFLERFAGGAFAGIGKMFGSIAASMQGVSKEKLQSWLEIASKKLEEFQGKLKKVWNSVRNFFAPGIDKVKKVLAPITKYFTKKVCPAIHSFVDEIVNAENPLSVLWTKIKSLAEPIQNLFEGWRNVTAGLNFVEWGKETGSSFTTVKKKLSELFNYVRKNFSNLDLTAVISALSIAAIVIFVTHIYNAISAFEKMATSIKDIGTSTKLFIDAAKTSMQNVSQISTYLKPMETGAKNIATNIVKVTGALIALVLAVYLLTTITDPNKLKGAVLAIAALAGIMIIFSAAITKIGSKMPARATWNIEKLQTTMLAFAGSILLLAIAVDMLSQVEINSWLDIFKMLGLLMVSFGLVITLMTHFAGTKFRACSLGMIAMAGSVLLLTIAMNLLIETVAKQGPEAMEALGKLLIMIAALGLAAGSAKFKGAMAIYIMVASILFLVHTLEKLKTFDFASVAANIGNIYPLILTLLSIFVLLSIAAKYMKECSKNVLAIAGSCALIIGCVYLLALVFEAISDMDQIKMGNAAASFSGVVMAVGVILLALGAAVKLAGENTKKIGKVGIALLFAVGAIYLLSLAYRSIAEFVKENPDSDVLDKAEGLLGGFMFLLSMVMLAAGGAAKLGGGKGLAYMIVVAVMLVSVLIAFYALAPLAEKLGPVSTAILFALVGIAAIILAMGYATKLASGEKTGKGAGLMLLMIIPFLAVAAALYMLSGKLQDVSWQILLVALGGIALVLLAMAGAARLASKAEISGIGAMIALAAVLIGFAAAVRLVAELPFDQLLEGAAVLAGMILVMGIFAAVAGVAFEPLMMGTIILVALAGVLLITAAAFAIFAASLYTAAAGILYAKGAWDYLKTGSRESWDMAAAMDAEARAMREAADNTQNEIDAATDDITESVENQNDVISEATEEGTKEIEDATEAQAEAIEEQADTISNAASSGSILNMQAVKDALVSKGINLDNLNLDSLNSTQLGSLLTENGINIGDMMLSGSIDGSSLTSAIAGSNLNLFGESAAGATAAGDEAGKNFTSAYDSSLIVAAGDTYTSGLNFVQGLIDGIADMTSPLIDVVEALATAALAKINEIWDENSPSKETAYRGMHFVNGLIVGIKANEKYAIYAIEDLANNTLDTLTAAMDSEELGESVLQPVLDMNEVLSQMNSFGESSAWSPTIRPQLDMSGVNPGLSNLNAIASYHGASKAKTVPDGTDSATGSGNVTFNQYNTSPKALSRFEIYRQTKNQIAFIGRVTRE